MNIKPILYEDAVFPDLEKFQAPHPSSTIQIIHPEFTSVCPKTGYPDFARIIIQYHPGDYCVELKSLKLYLAAWYGVGCFHERITATIAELFVTRINPDWCRITTEWGARGGLKTVCSIGYNRVGGWHRPLPSAVKAMADSEINWLNS